MQMPLILATATLALAWLWLMPPDTRGRSWHRVHACLPLAVVLLTTALPDGALKHALWLWVVGGGPALAVLALAWLAGTRARNHGMMDVAYPIAPSAIAWCVAILSWRTLTSTAWAVLALVSLWSLRLTVQTYQQNHADEREPYASWRARGGRRWMWWSFFQVHLLQGVMLWVWSAPLVFAVLAPASAPAVGAGALIWLIGFGLQAGSDRQLSRFRSDPANRGRLLDTGLWALVRQPNYLGEAVMWWGYFVCALAHPWGWTSLAAPLFTTWFMGFGSAGPFKERHMARTRGAAWTAYCARTPRFFPWPRPDQNGAR